MEMRPCPRVSASVMRESRWIDTAAGKVLQRKRNPPAPFLPGVRGGCSVTGIVSATAEKLRAFFDAAPCSPPGFKAGEQMKFVYKILLK
jgi:hypothetical protein